LCSLILFIFFQHAHAQHNTNFEIKGSLSQRDTGLIILSYKNSLGVDVNDTAIVKKGSFNFKGNIKEPTLAGLSGELKTKRLDDPNLTTIFLESKAMKLLVENNNFKEAVLIGSRSQLDYQKLLALEKPYHQAIDSLRKVYAEIEKVNKGNQNTAIKDSLAKTFAKIQLKASKLQDVDLNFISSNPNSIVSPYLLLIYSNGRKISIDSAQKLLDRLSIIVKKSELWSLVSKSLNVQRQVKIMRQNSLQTGKAAFNFSRKSNLGKEITLSLYKDKQYVLLDFWAGWCIPCLKFVPHLKEIANRYAKNGLEVISISMDRDMESWKRGIIQHGLDAFINIHDYENETELKNKNLLSAISTKYSVEAIPTYVLIDKNGIVLGVYNTNENNEIPALDEKLGELFK
jgi:thiol-disulfide isomerase/thioredoxin